LEELWGVIVWFGSLGPPSPAIFGHLRSLGARSRLECLAIAAFLARSLAAGVPLIDGRGLLAFSLIAWCILALVTSEPHSGQRTLSLIYPPTSGARLARACQFVGFSLGLSFHLFSSFFISAINIYLAR